MTVVDQTGDSQTAGVIPRLLAPRFGTSASQTALDLGPLASLRGSWRGTGFSVMWRPNNDAAQVPPPAEPFGPIKRYLQLNRTIDSFDFQAIPGQIPNRGLQPQDSIDLYGLHYLQRVSDGDRPPFLNAGEALHIEPGLFMYVPANDNSDAPGFQSQDTIVRMGSIPHGVNVLMQGAAPSATPVPQGPTIPNTYPIPGLPTFPSGVAPANPPGGNDVVGLGIQPFETNDPSNPEHIVPEVRIANDVQPTPADLGMTVQSNGPYPPDFQRMINNPNSVLQDHIRHQEIVGTITISMSTVALDPGIAQIPFLGVANNPSQPLGQQAFQTNLVNNCYVERADATFWLEWVQAPGAPGDYGHRGPFGEDAEGNCLQLDPTRYGPTFLQLQYSQTVILVFNGVFWPHITVATLHLSNG